MRVAKVLHGRPESRSFHCAVAWRQKNSCISRASRNGFRAATVDGGECSAQVSMRQTRREGLAQKLGEECRKPTSKLSPGPIRSMNVTARRVRWLGVHSESRQRHVLATPRNSHLVQGNTVLIPVSSQKSTNAGYKSLPYPKHAYSLVQLSSILSTSQ